MATDRANDLQAFRSFIDEGLADGGAGLTLDEALARDYENSGREREETRAAIRRGLADVDAGRVRPFEEFDREFRTSTGFLPIMTSASSPPPRPKRTSNAFSSGFPGSPEGEAHVVQPQLPPSRRRSAATAVHGGFQVRSTTTSRTPSSLSTRSRMPSLTRPPPRVTRKS